VPTPTLVDATALRDGNWYRLHPLPPVLQGGVVLLGILGFVADRLFVLISNRFGGRFGSVA
jgi:hypothetical protein